MRKNILFFMGVYPNYGGVERVSTVLANTFVERGYGVSILSFEQPHPEFAEKELNESVTLYKFDYPVFSSSNVKRLHDIIENNGIDVIINQWAVPFYVARLCSKAMADTSCKLITVHHNLPNTNARIKDVELDIEQEKGIKLFNYIKLFAVTLVSRISLRYVYEKSDSFVVLSNSFLDLTKKFIWLQNAPKLICIPNPMTIKVDDIESFEKCNEIIYVGRIEYNQKRCYRLLNAWRVLQNDYPDWKLTFVGDGPDVDDMKCKIKDLRLKNVFLDGYQDPIKYYKRASILMLVSEYEGFGLVIIEGMSYGVVPIVYGSYGAVYDIIDNEKNGFITTTPYSEEKTVECMKKLMDNAELRFEMAENARKKSDEFSLRSVIEKWELVIQ